MKKKIKSVLEVKEIVKKIQKQSKKVVMCHGAFDVLHYGHIMHFEEAKSQGDILIVSITTDKFISKGPNRPYFNEQIRCNTIASLGVVDFVVPSDSDVAISNIISIKPDIYCKGPDYKNNKEDITGNIKREINAIKKVKGNIYYTNKKTYSSSKLINIFSDSFNEGQKQFLNKIKSKHSLYYINNIIELLSKKKILVIGETIIDEYIFCKAVGKSGKEPVLVLQKKNKERFLGGIGAVANNISNFVTKTGLVSFVGQKNPELSFIKNNTNKNIDYFF